MYCVPQILVSIGDVEDDAHVNGGEVGLISFQNFTFIGHSRETGRGWTEGFFHFLHQIGNRGVIWSVDDFFPESRHHDYCAGRVQEYSLIVWCFHPRRGIVDITFEAPGGSKTASMYGLFRVSFKIMMMAMK